MEGLMATLRITINYCTVDHVHTEHKCVAMFIYVD